ncbi:hypothetical protein ACFORG_00340 [Lutimaribacter marinistellae]|uniref:Secreted protein n=1 Tax=Lutimaribacter marinistellae TaxID=1820329 RepID=A0ABV7TAM1_9RHOB
MHRKFIALVVSTAIAITGLSAAPARAADPHDILGGLAALAILGAAINHYDKKRERERARSYQPPVTRNHSYHDQPGPRLPAKKLPDRVRQYDLPSQCLRQVDSYRRGPVLGSRCLQRNYAWADRLPRSCEVDVRMGDRFRRAYDTRCLRQQGYRVVVD